MQEFLFDQNRHEALTVSEWNPDTVLEEIDVIVDDVSLAATTDIGWPTHSLDSESYRTDSTKWAMYAGASGVVLGMQILTRYGYTKDSFSHQLNAIHSAYLKNPDVSLEAGLQLGELGVLVPAFLFNPDDCKTKNRLIECMEMTIDLPLYEITSGQTGMMHVALFLYRKTNDNVWKKVYLDGAKSLLENWSFYDDTNQWLWESRVFGPSRHYYGACHGVVGNANILLQGMDLLDDDYTDLVIERTVSTLTLSAKRNSGMANWNLCTGPDIEKRLVQWCHGAAGIITAMSGTPASDSSYSRDLDKLLMETGELVWKAGALTKGSNICHGTAGNGYAFLYLYRRWGDQLWLDRARKFAAHAIEQCCRDRVQFKQGRYSLWTGDVGLAIFLHHCLVPEEAALPGLELF